MQQNNSKDIFYYSPYLPPENNAAAIRNHWFIRVLKENHNLKVHSNQNTIFKLPTNKQGLIIRLLKESFVGLELSLRILFSFKKTYILSSPPYITILLASITCAILKKRYILDIRDVYPNVFFSLKILKEDSLAGKFLKFLTRYTFHRAKTVITVTEGFKNKILDFAPKTNIEIIYNGYDDELFKPSDDKFENYTVVFHGNLGKFQRIDLLVEIAKEVFEKDPTIQFNVIGKGPGEKYLQDPPPNVEYLGEMKFEELGKYIAKCHLGLNLRTDDEISNNTIPVKVFEYLGVGIPVLSTFFKDIQKFDNIYQINERNISSFVYKKLSFNKQILHEYSRSYQSSFIKNLI